MSNTQDSAPANLSAGGGIAIATIWIVTTALTVFFVLLLFTNILVDNTVATESIRNASGDRAALAFLVMIVIAALPYTCAMIATKMILGKD